MKPIHNALMALAMANIGGCAQIEIRTPDAEPQIEQRFGFVNIDLAKARQSYVLRASGFGFARLPTVAVLGFHVQDLVVLGDDCRVVIWPDDQEQINVIEKQIRHLGNVCVVDSTKKETLR